MVLIPKFGYPEYRNQQISLATLKLMQDRTVKVTYTVLTNRLFQRRTLSDPVAIQHSAWYISLTNILD